MHTKNRRFVWLANNESESGQSVVLIAILMLGLLGFLGLALDGGQVFASRRRSQNASDAAALAGARVLATRLDNSSVSELKVWLTILSFGQSNGISTTNMIATFIDKNGNYICGINQNCNGVPSSPLATGVRVTTTLPLDPYFIRLLIGNQTIPVRSVAAAQSGAPTLAGGAIPVVITATEPITYGVEMPIWGDKVASGSFQWVSFSCVSDAKDVADYLHPDNTNPAPVVEADPQNVSKNPSMEPTASWLCTSPGSETNKQVTDALDAWLLKPESERLWLVPVYNYANCNPDKNGKCDGGSNAKFHIVRFAEFIFEGYNLGGGKNGGRYFLCPGKNDKCLQVKFIKFVSSNNLMFRPGPCNSMGLDMCAIGLSQ